MLFLYVMAKRIAFLMASGLILLAVSCSQDKGPYHPPYLVSGKVSIYNQSGVRIRLMEFTQKRGDEEVTVILDRRVNSGFRYFFINQLDAGGTDIFPGGDYIEVHYVADVPYPGQPNRPLFDQTFNHTVNGVTTYYVKSGGRYTVQP